MRVSTRRLRIRSESDATHSLFVGARFAQDLGFPKADCQAVSTAVSELSRNILKYAGEGEILLEEVRDGRRVGVQVTAKDRGPGIEDVKRAMRDHFSTSGTLGLGLPGIRRLMDDFEIESAPGEGTRVVVRKWRDGGARRARSRLLDAAMRASVNRTAVKSSEGELPREAPADGDVDCAFYIRPCRGERVSGDAVVIDRKGRHVFMAIVDGLGHGPAAALIADQATSFLKSSWTTDLVQTMQRLHEVLSETDGAGAGLCLIDASSYSVRYVGVGNTVMRVVGGKDKKGLSVPGTLGRQIRTPQEQPFLAKPGELVLLYTDGVREQFEIEDYPQLRYQDARTIARTIVTRYGKSHDDAGCVVFRYVS